MREHCNVEELEAHRVLDMVARGEPVPEHMIRRALFVLGDADGLRDV